MTNLRPEQRPFECHGAANRLLYANNPEILFHGPRGSGKSIPVLNKLVALCSLWERPRFLILRKTMKSLRETILASLEEKVLPQGHPALASR